MRDANILITGTPGTGKTTVAKAVAVYFWFLLMIIRRRKD